MRGEADANETALFGGVDVEPVEIGAQDALLLGLGTATKIEGINDAAYERRRLQRAVELRFVGKAFRGDNLDGEIGRHERAHVRVDRLLVHAGGERVGRGRIVGLHLALRRHQLDLRLGGVLGRHEGENDVGGNAGREA